MRAFLATVLLAAVAFSGCMGDGDDTSTTQPPAAEPGPRLDCSISNWEEPCLVRASPNESSSKTEIDIAVNPTDPDNAFVASKDTDPLASDSCVWAVGQYTRDGGRTWNTTYVGGTLDERGPGDLLYGWQCITDPILAYGPDGTLYYSLQVYQASPRTGPLAGLPLPLETGGIMVTAVSHDGGATFPDMVVLHAGDNNYVFHDYMHMGASPTTGTVFTIWNQLTLATIPALGAVAGESIPVLVAVEQGSDTARPPVYLVRRDGSPSPPNLDVSLGESSLVVGADGTVYAFLAGFNSPDAAYLSVSDDDGMTFTEPTRVFGFTPMGELANVSFRHGTVVELASDNSADGDGCLHAVWGGQENGTVGPSDIYARRSCDKGATWTEPVLVNADTRGDGQWMPRVSVDGRGIVHTVYLTRHHHGQFVDAEHAWSTDGGMTWQTERLTATSFDGDLGIHQEGFPFLGDYIGIASVGDVTYMGFPTTVTGRAEIAVAKSVWHA